MKPVRGAPGGVLGGKALVAMSMNTGLAVAMHAHPDGDAHEVPFLPHLLPVVREHVPGTRWYVLDRAFSAREQWELLGGDGDLYVVRHNPCVPFEPDPDRPACGERV